MFKNIKAMLGAVVLVGACVIPNVAMASYTPTINPSDAFDDSKLYESDGTVRDDVDYGTVDSLRFSLGLMKSDRWQAFYPEDHFEDQLDECVSTITDVRTQVKARDAREHCTDIIAKDWKTEVSVSGGKYGTNGNLDAGVLIRWQDGYYAAKYGTCYSDAILNLKAGDVITLDGTRVLIDGGFEDDEDEDTTVDTVKEQARQAGGQDDVIVLQTNRARDDYWHHVFKFGHAL